jgi:hypothetical protein
MGEQSSDAGKVHIHRNNATARRFGSRLMAAAAAVLLVLLLLLHAAPAHLVEQGLQWVCGRRGTGFVGHKALHAGSVTREM